MTLPAPGANDGAGGAPAALFGSDALRGFGFPPSEQPARPGTRHAPPTDAPEAPAEGKAPPPVDLRKQIKELKKMVVISLKENQNSKKFIENKKIHVKALKKSESRYKKDQLDVVRKLIATRRLLQEKASKVRP